MYDITNKYDVVREAKKYLYLVQEYLYPEIGRNSIDGIYDESTVSSVKKYQEYKGLSPSGYIDLKTFDLLFNDYDSIRRNLNAPKYIITSNGFPITHGEMSEDVRIIHGIMNELKRTFTELYDVGHGSYYSKRTAENASMLRNIFGLRDGDDVDSELYQRMILELDAHKRNIMTRDIKEKKRV